MSLPRLRPAFRFALIGLALALVVTLVAAGPFAPFVLLALWSVLVPAVLAGLLFAGGTGDWLERRHLAARGWAGALLGLATLAASATAAGLCAWVLEGADDGPATARVPLPGDRVPLRRRPGRCRRAPLRPVRGRNSWRSCSLRSPGHGCCRPA